MSAVNRLRSMRTYQSAVTSAHHVALAHEVQVTFDHWFGHNPHAGVLIGGLAMSFYRKPRYTEDVDVLYLNRADIPPSHPEFRRIRPGAFENKATHGLVEVTTPESFDMLPDAVAKKVIETHEVRDGIKVASREGLAALKLCSSFARNRKLKDMADVFDLLPVDLADWPLEQKHFDLLEEIRNHA